MRRDIYGVKTLYILRLCDMVVWVSLSLGENGFHNGVANNFFYF